MDEKTVLAHIHELVEEEKQLRAAHHGLTRRGPAAAASTRAATGPGVGPAAPAPRPRASSARTPTQAQERSVNEVEGYLQ